MVGKKSTVSGSKNKQGNHRILKNNNFVCIVPVGIFNLIIKRRLYYVL